MNEDGSATVVTGAQENGSGAVMGLALLVAEELGIDSENVSFVYQDTDAGPWDAGSAGSQTTFNVGRAVLEASAKVRQRIIERASESLEAAPEDLVIAAGTVHVKGVPARGISVSDVVSKSMEDGEQLLAASAPTPPPMPESFGGSSCVGRIAFPSFAAPAFVCQAARVLVDRETGVTRVLEVAAAHDFGRVLNPVGAEGQVEGGVAMGVGIALWEGTVYQGGQQRNPDLLDYKIATAADAPNVKIAFVDAPVAAERGGPHGSKGVGEPPCVPTPGAVANAIADACRVRPHRLPMTASRVWSALQEAR
jgi:CO/xanthine dehydrogenase Mo-binding subunit